MSQMLEKINMMKEDELRKFLGQEASGEEMEVLFGDEAEAVKLYAETEPDKDKQGDSLLIMLPGLMGSVLADKNSGVIWVNPFAFLKGRMNDLDLKPDGKTDAVSGVKIFAPNPLWIAYAKIVMRLEHGFETHSFPYDWRRSTVDTAKQLMAFIDEKLAASPHDKVTLVGHSLGGIVTADYLVSEATKAHAEKHLARAITLGSPFKGAVDAFTVLAGQSNDKMDAAKKLSKKNRPDQMVRSLPSTYQILPAPRGLYKDWDPIPDLDIYDPAMWKEQGIAINEKHLAQAKIDHEVRAKGDPQVDFINIVGIHYDTKVSFIGKMLDALPKIQKEGPGGGDGTVAIQSAIFPGRTPYYIHEEHVELVIDRTVIGSIMEWTAGGHPTDLVQNIDDVVLDDGKLRAAAEPEETVDMDAVAKKLEAGEELTHAEIKAMYTVM